MDNDTVEKVVMGAVIALMVVSLFCVLITANKIANDTCTILGYDMGHVRITNYQGLATVCENRQMILLSEIGEGK